ncbi:hypothetical protein [Cellulosimicrobium protaetiae]
MTGFWAWFHDGWEIVGALASAFAAGVALWLASRERADRQAAEKDRDEAREAQRRAELAEARREREAQARQVVLWLVHYGVPVEAISGKPVGPPSALQASVKNYSSMAILDVSIVVLDEGAEHVHSGSERSAIQPGDQWAEYTKVPPPGRDWTHAVEFRDAAGARWRRYEHGRLRSLDAAIVDTDPG